jgi:hypothetical protein
MYKDKEKQKQANRAAAQRRRDKAKGMTQGMTKPGYDAQGMTEVLQPKPDRLMFDDLPSDVQASIEKFCAENNNGERAASHSRQAMTERALDYQRQFGKRPSQGIHTPACQSLMDDQVCGCTCGPPNTIAEQVERDIHEPVGPLDAYSAERWARLQAKGYVWVPEAVSAKKELKGVTYAVPVPGDPAYSESAIV